MEVIHSFDQLRQHGQRFCLAIGVFDGVHRGHQAVIRAALEDAQTCGARAAVVTFAPHPMRILAPSRAPLSLTSTPHKLALIGQLGVPVCLVIRFNREFAAVSPEDFIEMVASRTPDLQTICVGSRFHFGKDRRGNTALIRALSAGRSFRLHELPSVTLEGEVISSTAVRLAVSAGDLDKAAKMLGRPFSILGTVVGGDRRGRKLGFPTANLDRHNEVAPPNGVYAVRARVAGQLRPGLVNIGVRPTVSSHARAPLLELHVLDFSGDLYRQDVEVFFIARLRDEKKFPSLDDLRAQIERDVQQARNILAA
ncbi:MAG: bifunctional riboflavin kinase/FAD synthetase [Verrucomicrobia bacterium]|nr:bifunctional riboflavin kinase/FAD synthetase [Verrucomicrobiota bacterium]